MNKKILVFHDTFLYKWWGERLIIMMWKSLNADIASWFFSPGSFDLRKEGFCWKMITVSSEVFTKGFRHIKLKWAFFFHAKFIREYHTIIFSGDSLSAVRNCPEGTKKIYYCHTPPRYLYDLHELYLKKVPFYLKPFFLFFCYIFRLAYKYDISKIDIILTNSMNTQKRIQKYLWYEARVLYPPVDMQKFYHKSSKGYFLSFARLADAKRVDMVVRAFQKLPNEELIVIYGKNDPQKDMVISLAQGYKNIRCITLDDNNDLYEYIACCRASIYIPLDEDFWMSPVESMSAWKPVLWVNDGGLKETIIHKKTWYLTPKNICVEDIVSWVTYLSEDRCSKLSENCREQAHKFSLEHFEKNLHDIVFHSSYSEDIYD